MKEKKLLLEKIRRKFLKILKENHKSQLSREAEKAIFQALEDLDFDGMLNYYISEPGFKLCLKWVYYI